MTRRLRVVPPAEEKPDWSNPESIEQIALRALSEPLKNVVIVGEYSDGETYIASTYASWNDDLGLLVRGQKHVVECIEAGDSEAD